MTSSYAKFFRAIDAHRFATLDVTGLAQKWFGQNGHDHDHDRGTEPETRSGGGRSQDRSDSAAGRQEEDMAFLGEAGQLLQACRSVEEVCNVARNRLQRVSPGLSGALYLMNDNNDYLENRMVWGDMDRSEEFFAPGDCWALRCGRPHQVGSEDKVITCAHTEASKGDWHLCLPLIAQGEALGVLYFSATLNGPDREEGYVLASHDRLQFYLNFSETLALAIANIRLRETLQHQAIRDPLTGLFNRRYLEETLRRELHRAARAEQPLTVVMADIDHFKRLNDTFGHDAGDAVLKAVGGILQSRTRAGDVACRYGGEEFALVFPGMPADVAVTRVETLREEIAARDIHYLGQTLDQITVSLGVAVFPQHAMDLESLVHAADQALYRSKKDGRNRHTIAILPRRKSDTKHASGPPQKRKRAQSKSGRKMTGG